MYAFERRLTCLVPSGRSPAGTPSGNPVDVPGMFQTSQCVMSIFEPRLSTGSGSCISRTKLCVPDGTCDHFNSGDGAVGPDACVYLSGMTPPSSHALELMISGGFAGPRPPPAALPCPAGGVCCVGGALALVTTAVTNTDAATTNVTDVLRRRRILVRSWVNLTPSMAQNILCVLAPAIRDRLSSS